MDKYRFLLEIDGKKIEFTCAYKEFNLDKEAEIKILDKEKIK